MWQRHFRSGGHVTFSDCAPFSVSQVEPRYDTVEIRRNTPQFLVDQRKQSKGFRGSGNFAMASTLFSERRPHLFISVSYRFEKRNACETRITNQPSLICYKAPVTSIKPSAAQTERCLAMTAGLWTIAARRKSSPRLPR